jgi:hypothetical protein
MNIFFIVAIQALFFLLPILSGAQTVQPLNLDCCVSYLAGKDKANSHECLAELEKLDLLFLSGDQKAIQDWKIDEKILLRVKRGDKTALGVGFRLVVVLNGEPEESLIKALGESMENEPDRFLVCLQGVIDFARRENQEGSVKKYLWDDFVSSDLGYGDKLEEQIAGTRKRSKVIKKVNDPSIKEAQVYVLDMLDEKIEELSAGM